MIGLLRELLIVTVLLVLLWMAGFLRSDVPEPSAGLVAMTVGFALLAAHLLGRILAKAELPMITGYLLAGVLLGPHILGFIGLEVKERLAIINQIALGLIALTAGGELALERLRPRLKGIGWVSSFHTLFIFSGTLGLLVLLELGFRQSGGELVLTAGLDWPQIMAMGLILGLVATANSPASAVAVINETRSRGALTTLSLGVTLVKDVVVIVLMGVTLSLARSLVSPGSAFEVGLLLEVLLEVVLSIALGALLGAIIILYLARVNREVALFLLAMVFLAIEVAGASKEIFGVHAHFLLICMTAGFGVENASQRGDALIQGIEKSSLPVYVVFFTFSGVGLDLGALRRMWPLAVGFAIWRGVTLYVTSLAGAAVAGESRIVRRTCWTAFVAQAGVSLGLAELVATRYPEMGDRIKTLVLASIAVNQLLGPVLFKLALRRSGEAGRADEAPEAETGKPVEAPAEA